MSDFYLVGDVNEFLRMLLLIVVIIGTISIIISIIKVIINVKKTINSGISIARGIDALRRQRGERHQL